MSADALPVDALEVRRVTPADWRAVRQLRLAALAETPLAFCERWADAAGLDDDDWRARTARGTDDGPSIQVMAWDGGRAVATASAYVEDGVAWLVAVHVAPDARGSGLLARLVEPVRAWAVEQRVPELRLEVHEDNPRAAAAYRRLGFTETGRRRPYPLDPTGDELEMSLPLSWLDGPAYR